MPPVTAAGSVGLRVGDMSTIRNADTADLDRLADVLARAFVDDPFAEWAIPGDPSTREKVLRAQFRAEHEKVFLPSRTVEVVAADVVVAQAVWAEPGTPPDDPSPQVGRVAEALATIESRHPEETHWYLAYLGTDPDHRMRGHARALLAAGLERVDRDGVAAYLWTAKAGNVPFYERFGFEVTWNDAPAGCPPVWGMVRPASRSNG